MQFGPFQYRRQGSRQQGYFLLLLMLMVALVLIGLSVELPSIVGQIRRDREDELIHRGAQYARAIKKYYKKTGAYPVSLDQLLNTNNVRFLRKKYKDPITGKDFKLLHMGEVQISAAIPGVAGAAGALTPATAAAAVAAASAMSGNATTNPVTGTTVAGTTSSGGFGSSPFTSINGGNTGAVLGGGPIVGVASTSDKKSFHVFNKKDHYKDWQFIYDPTLDRVGNCPACSVLITGPYNGVPSYGGGQVPGAVSPGQMQSGSNPLGTSGQAGTFGQNPGTVGQPGGFGQPFGQNSASPSPSSPFSQQ